MDFSISWSIGLISNKKTPSYPDGAYKLIIILCYLSSPHKEGIIANKFADIVVYRTD